MHDPMTVAHEIKKPWKRGGYRDAVVTIWHNDPELDGSDDSCGWFAPKVPRELGEEIAKAAREEHSFWFGEQYASINLRQGTARDIVTAAWLHVRYLITGKRYSKLLSRRDEHEITVLVSHPGDNLLGLARAARDDARELERLLFCVARNYLRLRRPWYRHPRWHVWHWSVQVHALQTFKRWAFTRCAECGRRFAWGESGIGTWSGPGPLWFASETLTHMRCAGITDVPRSPITETPETET